MVFKNCELYQMPSSKFWLPRPVPARLTYNIAYFLSEAKRFEAIQDRDAGCALVGNTFKEMLNLQAKRLGVGHQDALDDAFLAIFNPAMIVR